MGLLRELPCDLGGSAVLEDTFSRGSWAFEMDRSKTSPYLQLISLSPSTSQVAGAAKFEAVSAGSG